MSYLVSGRSTAPHHTGRSTTRSEQAVAPDAGGQATHLEPGWRSMRPSPPSFSTLASSSLTCAASRHLEWATWRADGGLEQVCQRRTAGSGEGGGPTGDPHTALTTWTCAPKSLPMASKHALRSSKSPGTLCSHSPGAPSCECAAQLSTPRQPQPRRTGASNTWYVSWCQSPCAERATPTACRNLPRPAHSSPSNVHWEGKRFLNLRWRARKGRM